MRSPIFPRHRVTVMGVLNATPDSFSDGGRFVAHDRPDVDAAVAEALRMQRAGAHVLDVGGESTRPGAADVPEAIEIARVVPILEALAKTCELPLSIDTRKSAVARAALAAGACIVNDVSGGCFDRALFEVVAERGAWLVLGHLRGTPATMQHEPHFDDVLAEVAGELAASVARAEAAGVAPERIVVDPGIGFGKRQQDNLALLANVGWLGERLGKPVLVGPSRKAFLGQLTGDPIDERDVATAAACAVAVFAGASAIRVHDVGVGVRAARVAASLRAVGTRTGAEASGADRNGRGEGRS
jgi:dihydropteroate synthase